MPLCCRGSLPAAVTTSPKEGPWEIELSWPKCLFGLRDLLVSLTGSDFTKASFWGPTGFGFFEEAQSDLERGTEHPGWDWSIPFSQGLLGPWEVLNPVLCLGEGWSRDVAIS